MPLPCATRWRRKDSHQPSRGGNEDDREALERPRCARRIDRMENKCSCRELLNWMSERSAIAHRNTSKEKKRLASARCGSQAQTANFTIRATEYLCAANIGRLARAAHVGYSAGDRRRGMRRVWFCRGAGELRNRGW